MYINPIRNEESIFQLNITCCPLCVMMATFFNIMIQTIIFIVLIIDSTPAETSTEGKNTSYAPGYISSITIWIHFDYLELNRFFYFSPVYSSKAGNGH